VNLGSLLRSAGFVRATELSRARVNCVSPKPTAGAVKTPMLFQLLAGASSTYWPITTWAHPGAAMKSKRIPITKTEKITKEVHFIRFCMTNNSSSLSPLLQIPGKCVIKYDFGEIMADNTKRKIKIVGIGSYTPEKVLTNADLEKMVDTSDEWIVTRTGIKERRIAPDDQATSDLGIEAGRIALKDAGLTVDDVDLILVATNTTDTPFPSTACWIQKGLGADHVPAFDVSAGCTGFLYGMIIAESLILNGTNKRVLLLGPEMLTKVTNWEDRATCVLFGDGAGAFVLEESSDESGMLSSYWKADGNLADLLWQPGGGTRNPITHEMIDQGLQYLVMKGNEVFKHAVKRMGEAALESLKKAGLTKDDVDYLVPHQANIRIIDATGRRLNLPPDKVFVNVDKYGNMSVATIPVGVDELYREGKLKKGDIIVMDAFGAGFTWAALVYRW
jgi:3-oxoacyl-[acyl-carrier-protein] synthase-3